MFDFGSQHLEIFFLPAVPTEHLDGVREPQIPTTLHTVIWAISVILLLSSRIW